MAKTTTINNAKEVIEKYPKVMDILKAWLTEEFQSPVDDSFLEILLSHNPRFLYDFFDEKDVVISLGPMGKEFTFDIFTDSVVDDEDHPNFPGRPEAEEAAFLKAFEILNNEG